MRDLFFWRGKMCSLPYYLLLIVKQQLVTFKAADWDLPNAVLLAGFLVNTDHTVL